MTMDNDMHRKFFIYKIIHMAHITHVYGLIFFMENPLIAGFGAWESYECYQNTNYFPALVKEYVILDVQLDPLDGLQCFQIYQIQINI